jgi:hypothetical protein
VLASFLDRDVAVDYCNADRDEKIKFDTIGTIA